MPLFAVLLTYIDDRDRIAKVRPAHREHLQRQYAAGKLYHAGPFVDDSGGMAIYAADSEAEVREILAKDPFITQGIVREAKVKEWTLVFNGSNTES